MAVVAELILDAVASVAMPRAARAPDALLVALTLLPVLTLVGA